jgi:hypothetical protein
MSIRHVVKTVAVSGAATICGAVLMLGIGAGPAGASTLTSSDGNTSLSTIGTVSPGPYSSGQGITVSVAANSVMNTTNLTNAGAPTTGNFYIEECADPGGTIANLPTTYQGCEAATLATAAKSTDGSLTLTGGNAYTVYDLPDPNTLGSATMVGTCDIAPNQCVIGIFADNPNFGHAGFSYPHLFSAPFQATVGDGNDVGDNPGDGTPEVPLAIGLPLAGLAIFGGFTIRNRRRRQRQSA